MKRLALCVVAALLASGALMSKPAYACTTNPLCFSDEDCPIGKKCNFCSGRCVTG
jgi:hypothetical protein